MPDPIRAIGLTSRPPVGGLSDTLANLSLPEREPGRWEVRVRVLAAALNIDDQHMAEGSLFGGLPLNRRPRPDRPLVPGLDLSGVIDRVGAGVTRFSPGDKVFGIANPLWGHGSWATSCCTLAAGLHHVPADWSIVEAAGMGVAASTAAGAFKKAGGVEGRACVVVGASGGIGGLLVRMLVAAGARVAGVCSARNAEQVERWGTERIVDYTLGPWSEQLTSENYRADRIFDCVGGRDTERGSRRLLDRRGRFLTLCGPERFVGEKMLGPWKLSRMLSYIAWRMCSSRVRGPRYVMVSGGLPDWPLIERRFLQPDIRRAVDRVVPFTLGAVSEGIRYVASHRARGKVVVAMDDGLLKEPTNGSSV